MNIFIFLGTSGSGKTTEINRRFLDGNICKDGKYYDVPVSIVGNETVLFGKYNVESRCKGCDTLSMSIIDNLLNALKGIIDDNEYKNIVLDGDRINNSKMMNFLKDYKKDVTIVWMKTDLDIIFDRLPDCNKQFVKTTQTKTTRSIAKYSALGFNIEKVETKSTGGLFGY